MRAGSTRAPAGMRGGRTDLDGASLRPVRAGRRGGSVARGASGKGAATMGPGGHQPRGSVWERGVPPGETVPTNPLPQPSTGDAAVVAVGAGRGGGGQGVSAQGQSMATLLLSGQKTMGGGGHGEEGGDPRWATKKMGTAYPRSKTTGGLQRSRQRQHVGTEKKIGEGLAGGVVGQHIRLLTLLSRTFPPPPPPDAAPGRWC